MDPVSTSSLPLTLLQEMDDASQPDGIITESMINAEAQLKKKDVVNYKLLKEKASTRVQLPPMI
jgi:hypothetical protein